MNILPKKSWHVRTKKNIERVRRDEANAAEEEKELKRRIQLAEQEARTDLLRKKAKGSSISENTHTIPSEVKEHVNFFEELEASGGFSGGTNKEHEEEEKARKEKFEKDIGLLTYLGQSSIEAKGEKPWYLTSRTSVSSPTKNEKKEEASAKHKSKNDPLNDMKKYLDIKEKKMGNKVDLSNKEKERTLTRKQTLDKSSKLSKIEELRAKRLKREREEKQRSQTFLETFRKGPLAAEEVVLDDRSRRYNSQFNPHLARNNIAYERPQ